MEEVQLKIMLAQWGLLCWKALESSSRVRHTEMASEGFEPSGYRDRLQILIEKILKISKNLKFSRDQFLN